MIDERKTVFHDFACTLGIVSEILERAAVISGLLTSGDFAYTKEYHEKDMGWKLLCNYEEHVALIETIEYYLKRCAEDTERLFREACKMELQEGEEAKEQSIK